MSKLTKVKELQKSNKSVLDDINERYLDLQATDHARVNKLDVKVKDNKQLKMQLTECKA